MKKLLAATALVGLLSLPAVDLEAQVEIGGQVGFADDVDFGVGALVVFSLEDAMENLELAASFDYYFPDGFNYWEIDAILRYLIRLEDVDNVVPFVAAGLAIGRFSFDVPDILDEVLPGFGFDGSSTEPGLKVGGGLKFPGDSATPFVDIMLGLGDIPSFSIRGGVTISVGG